MRLIKPNAAFAPVHIAIEDVNDLNAMIDILRHCQTGGYSWYTGQGNAVTILLNSLETLKESIK